MADTDTDTDTDSWNEMKEKQGATNGIRSKHTKTISDFHWYLLKRFSSSFLFSVFFTKFYYYFFVLGYCVVFLLLLREKLNGKTFFYFVLLVCCFCICLTFFLFGLPTSGLVLHCFWHRFLVFGSFERLNRI